MCSGPNDYWIALFGQTVGAIAQIFVGINVSLPMAINWFGDAERVVATTVGLVFNIGGTGVSYALLPTLVPTGAALRDVMFIEAVYVSAVTLLVVLVFREHPPSPPSYAAKISAELMTTNIEKVIDEESRLTAGYQTVLFDEGLDHLQDQLGYTEEQQHSSLYGPTTSYQSGESPALLSRSQAHAIVITPPPRGGGGGGGGATAVASSSTAHGVDVLRDQQKQPLLGGASSAGGSYGAATTESHISSSSLPGG